MSAKLKLLTPEFLSENQRKVFEKYSRQFPTQGVCVNVAIGAESWDVRPLILERSRVWLHRYTKVMDPDVIRSSAAEWAGFAVISDSQIEVKTPDRLDQLLIIRPYYPNTLVETLRDGQLDDPNIRRGVARMVVQQVGTLIRRNLVHGHISPSNVAIVDDSAVLIDPRISLISGIKDEFTAPELHGVSGSALHELQASIDIYGLGRVLSQLLADSASRDEQEVIEQMTLPSPRQRPPFSVIEAMFGVEGPPLRVVKGGKKVVATSEDQSRTLSQKSEKDGDMKAAVGALFKNMPPFVNVKNGVISIALLGALLLVLERRFPHIYYEMAHYLPLLASERSPDYEVAWSSGERSKMASVAREAVFTRDPAAENAIIRQVTSGEKLAFPQLEFLKRSLDPLWRDELSRRDIRAAFAIALSPIVPEALGEVPPISSLHPALILSLAGAPWAKNSHKSALSLKGIKISVLAALPDPMGDLFGTFAQSGVDELDSPQGLGLAAMATGIPSAIAAEGYFLGADDAPQLLARLSLVLPILAAHGELAEQVFAALRDNGGPLSEALAWFDVEPVAKWNDVAAAKKLELVLGKVSYPGFDLSRYSDLLRFPLSSVRTGAAEILANQMFTPQAANMLSFLSGEQNHLNRSQVVALLSALPLKAELGSPFIATWFTTMNPDPKSVLLLLLARSNYSSEDIFNLEAASYLRKAEWDVTTDLLKLLANHPEPLARSLAYARLDSTKSGEMAILKERLVVESDPNLKRSIEVRVSGVKQKAPASITAPAKPEVSQKIEPTIPPGMEKVL